jgi:hypothetical protein
MSGDRDWLTLTVELEPGQSVNVARSILDAAMVQLDSVYLGGRFATVVLTTGRRLAEPFTCPRCGAVSHHPTDIAERYCGRCHDWPARAVTAAELLAELEADHRLADDLFGDADG